MNTLALIPDIIRRLDEQLPRKGGAPARPAAARCTIDVGAQRERLVALCVERRWWGLGVAVAAVEWLG